jgi:hypothetical protein
MAGTTTLQLLHNYAEAAAMHQRASDAGEHKKANSAYHVLDAIVREIYARGPEARTDFLGLLDNNQPGVRVWAATHALWISPERAQAVLQELASQPSSLVAFDARHVLQEWRKGELQPPY